MRNCLPRNKNRAIPSGIKWATVGLLACGVLAVNDGNAQAATERVSVSTGDTQGNARSYLGGNNLVSADGRYVAFASYASNFAPNDDTNSQDVFVRDRQLRKTELVSVTAEGIKGNDESWMPSMSADGRYVAFRSKATNLVVGDTNQVEDVFVRDRQTNTTERVSVSTSGAQGNAAVGRDSRSGPPSISANGRYVAFVSSASNTVTGDNNGVDDVFVHDREAKTTRRVSVSTAGDESNGSSSHPSISANGHYIAFHSNASNLIDDEHDTNFTGDIFVYNYQTNTTELVSHNIAGYEGNKLSIWPSISHDGNYVAFMSAASDLVPQDNNGAFDVFVRNRKRGITRRASVSQAGIEGNKSSGGLSAGGLSISGNGRYIAFTSAASNLVPDDTNGSWDAFVRDRHTGTIRRIPQILVDGKEVEASSSFGVSISKDGHYVAFSSLIHKPASMNMMNVFINY